MATPQGRKKCYLNQTVSHGDFIIYLWIRTENNREFPRLGCDVSSVTDGRMGPSTGGEINARATPGRV